MTYAFARYVKSPLSRVESLQVLMKVTETEDFPRVASLQRCTRNMRCHLTHSSLPRPWSSSSVASSLARPGKVSFAVCILCLIQNQSAFNAIISASVVALGVSYAIPPAINCLRGRKMLPPRPFVLPGPLGWMCNLLGIAYVIVTTVLFLFPPDLPVTGSNMSTSSISFGPLCPFLTSHTCLSITTNLKALPFRPHLNLLLFSNPILSSRQKLPNPTTLTETTH